MLQLLPLVTGSQLLVFRLVVLAGTDKAAEPGLVPCGGISMLEAMLCVRVALADVAIEVRQACDPPKTPLKTSVPG
jgi:hypothetical protein